MVMMSMTAFASSDAPVDMNALWKKLRLQSYRICSACSYYRKTCKKNLSLIFWTRELQTSKKAIKDAKEASESAKTEMTNYEIKMKGFEKRPGDNEREIS